MPDALVPELATKRDRLLAVLRELGSVAVALSGGIDSTLVAAAAVRALGDQAVAVTADSASVPRTELAEARRVAALVGIRHEVVRTDEFNDPDYVKNDGARCYFCKSELYERIEELLPRLGVAVVCSGANLDDQGDYRPGLKAAAEHAVRHPLQEAGFSKADVRALARAWGLPTWDKPASPCLSSRLAPGVTVTVERTSRVEEAEAYLRGLGLRDCRVRLHEGELARIEVAATELARLAAPEVREPLARRFKELGFRFVTLDLEGFRSGSLNVLVDLSIKQRFAPRSNMTNEERQGPQTVAPLPSRTALDAYFLEARCRLLDLAAILDRIGRGAAASAVEDDPRLAKVREALEVLHDRSGGRAERIQKIFSLDYDPEWERPAPRY